MQFKRIFMFQIVGMLLAGRTYDVEEREANKILDAGGLAEEVEDNLILAIDMTEPLELKNQPQALLQAGGLVYANVEELTKSFEKKAVEVAETGNNEVEEVAPTVKASKSKVKAEAPTVENTEALEEAIANEELTTSELD